MPRGRPPVNKDVLRWAVDESALSLDDLASRLTELKRLPDFIDRVTVEEDIVLAKILHVRMAAGDFREVN